MSMHLICDWCNKQILEGETYYTVHRHDIIWGDEIDDICCDCAEKLSVNLGLNTKERKRCFNETNS